MGVNDRKWSKEKLTDSRRAIGMIRSLTEDDYMRVYSHF